MSREALHNNTSQSIDRQAANRTMLQKSRRTYWPRTICWICTRSRIIACQWRLRQAAPPTIRPTTASNAAAGSRCQLRGAAARSVILNGVNILTQESGFTRAEPSRWRSGRSGRCGDPGRAARLGSARIKSFLKSHTHPRQVAPSRDARNPAEGGVGGGGVL